MFAPRTDVHDTCDPIACTLGGDALIERVAWIRRLNRTALRAYRVEGRRLSLDYAASAAPEVRALVARESQCCAFLTYDVKAQSETIRLIIEAPVALQESVDLVFRPFLEGVEGTRMDTDAELSRQEHET